MSNERTRTDRQEACQICGKPLREWTLKKMHRKCWKGLSKKQRDKYERFVAVDKPRAKSRHSTEEERTEKERRIAIYRRQIEATGKIDFHDPELQPRIPGEITRCA